MDAFCAAAAAAASAFSLAKAARALAAIEPTVLVQVTIRVGLNSPGGGCEGAPGSRLGRPDTMSYWQRSCNSCNLRGSMLRNTRTGAATLTGVDGSSTGATGDYGLMLTKRAAATAETTFAMRKEKKCKKFIFGDGTAFFSCCCALIKNKASLVSARSPAPFMVAAPRELYSHLDSDETEPALRREREEDSE